MEEQTKPLSTLALLGIISIASALLIITAVFVVPFIYNYVVNDMFN